MSCTCQPKPSGEAPDVPAIDCPVHGANPACEYVGHEWADAGGGLLICMVCEAEMWGDPRD